MSELEPATAMPGLELRSVTRKESKQLEYNGYISAIENLDDEIERLLWLPRTGNFSFHRHDVIDGTREVVLGEGVLGRGGPAKLVVVNTELRNVDDTVSLHMDEFIVPDLRPRVLCKSTTAPTRHKRESRIVPANAGPRIRHVDYERFEIYRGPNYKFPFNEATKNVRRKEYQEQQGRAERLTDILRHLAEYTSQESVEVVDLRHGR
jgi:hypothetical protein